MTKEYYQILEVSETATSEEIKKSYRKLAMKWHPDKFATKSLEEREEANKKMQQINQAYEILGDEEKKIRYDAGETNFTDSGGYNYEKSAWEAKEEKLKKKKDILEEILKNSQEEIEIMEEMWLLNADYIDRSATFNEISAAMGFSFPRVYKEDLKSAGYSKLWEPYKDWLDKVWEMPITIIRKEKERSDELKNFKEEMIKVVNETAPILEAREKIKKEKRTNSELDQARKKAIEAIERSISEKGLKIENLEEKYRNYQEQINNLEKVWKIRSLRDKVKESISQIGTQSKADGKFTPKGNYDSEDSSLKNPKKSKDNGSTEPTQPNSPINDDIKIIPNQPQQGKYDNWTKDELINRIEQLEAKISELEEDIKELKAEPQQTPEVKQEIQKRETQLQEVKASLSQIQNSSNGVSETKGNKFPTGFLIIGGIVVVCLGLAAILIKNKKKNKIKI